MASPLRLMSLIKQDKLVRISSWELIFLNLIRGNCRQNYCEPLPVVYHCFSFLSNIPPLLESFQLGRLISQQLDAANNLTSVLLPFVQAGHQKTRISCPNIWKILSDRQLSCLTYSVCMYVYV